MYKIIVVYEEISFISVIDLEVEARYITCKDPLERVLVGDINDGDGEAQNIVQFPNVAVVNSPRDLWETLNRVLGPPRKTSIEEAPKLELKAFLAHLRYAF